MLHDMILDEAAHEKWEATCPEYTEGMTYLDFIEGYKYPGLKPFGPNDMYANYMSVSNPNFKEDNAAHVCSRRFLMGFGEVQACVNANQYTNRGAVGSDFSAFVKIIESAKTKHDSRWGTSKQFHIGSMAWIEAVTSTGQPWAYRMLTQFGFSKIGPFKKRKHSETMTYMWLMTGADLVKALEAHTEAHTKG